MKKTNKQDVQVNNDEEELLCDVGFDCRLYSLHHRQSEMGERGHQQLRAFLLLLVVIGEVKLKRREKGKKGNSLFIL